MKNSTNQNWITWQNCPCLPDWVDEGKNIEMVLENGDTIRGRLKIIDMTPGPEEAPIFGIILASGETTFFDFNFQRWRFLP